MGRAKGQNQQMTSLPLMMVMTGGLRRDGTGSSAVSHRGRVRSNAARVAALGEWPEYISPESLLTRIPTGTENATGFDAGIACAMDLIPRNRQQLAARLHAAYTPEAVRQVRREADTMPPDAETTWWLAACSVCQEGDLTQAQFEQQINDFKTLAADPQARVQAAQREHEHMASSFQMDEDGVAFATVDGGMQGAYVAGHDVSAMYAEDAGLYFVGTLRPSLELDDFPWEQPANPNGATTDEQMGRSGPVHGSKQFVKCANEDEYRRVVAHVRDRLGPDAF